MYVYSELETKNQDGEIRENSATPQSYDIIIDNVMVLSNIKSPSGKQTLDFGELDGKEITYAGYKITFQFTSHRELKNRGCHNIPCFLTICAIIAFIHPLIPMDFQMTPSVDSPK